MLDKNEAKKLSTDGNVQASTLLAIGPAIWRLISNFANVDFLLGINGEKFNMFLNFLQGPGWIVLSIIGIIWLLIRVFFRDQFELRRYPTFWLLGSSVVVAFLFGILVAVNSTGGVPTVITAWGSPDLRSCVANVDMKRLLSFRKDYKLVVVCGFQDASQDRLEDENITVSNRFTITPGVLQIVANASFPMIQRTAALIKQAQISTGNPNASVALPVWYTAAIIPNDIPSSKVAKLGDVIVLGGKILDSQYFN